MIKAKKRKKFLIKFIKKRGLSVVAPYTVKLRSHQRAKSESAQDALAQIEEKHYAQKYLMSQKTIVLVGIFIDVEKRNIESWVTKTL